MILPHIQDLVAVCLGHGVKNAILSPGSRSAAISLAFNAHPEIDTKVIPDERSAAFIALGMAQQLNQPVVLVCTSGSASLNYAPAIAEAYYQEIPLVVITADRPPEWVNQYDGQTIQQYNIYGQHVKAFFEFPVSVDHPEAKWHANRLANEALIKSMTGPQGPVHLNIPLREPFYPTGDEQYDFNSTRIIEFSGGKHGLSESSKEALLEEWKTATTKWIVVGQHHVDKSLTHCLNGLSDKALIINEITGNQHEVAQVISEQDLLFQSENWPEIETPDLLITLGTSLISKNLKLFLRANPPQKHWHIGSSDRLNDIGQHLTRLVEGAPEEVLSLFVGQEANMANLALAKLNDEVKIKRKQFLGASDFGELKAMDLVLNGAPNMINIHLANSMSVRYANFIGLSEKGQTINCNRGTSGIDGSNSTAVGSALVNDQLTLLVTGDLAFFYDRNAFWNNESFPNLRIVVLNNDGGGIFNMIKGPKQQPDHEKIFLTPHGLKAKSLANEFGYGYAACHNEEELKSALKGFFADYDAPQIIEVFSSIEQNTAILHQLKSATLFN